MGKRIICRCEDVLAQDLIEAFEAGYRDLESLKRFTGFATGVCQGKGCMVHAARILSRLLGGDDVVCEPIRTRPLLHPVSVSRFAAEDGSDQNEGGS